MYKNTDPRASLTSVAAASAPVGPFLPPDLGRFYEDTPQVMDAGAQTWLLRGQNMIVAYTLAEQGTELSRSDQVDEYAVLAPSCALQIVHRGMNTEVPAGSLAFVPPGPSTVRLMEPGSFTRLFTSRSPDLAAACSNAAAYTVRNNRVAEIVSWPEPPEGWRVRVYPLDVPSEPGRFGRIWRCTTLMVNYLDPRHGPRDPARMSPHSHADFEQCSLALDGEFVHHMRWPWTTNMAEWMEDRHDHLASPSACIIPPPSIHTSQALSSGLNQLVDIFCPPRRDFSEKAGWVLNDADYPAPR